MLANLISLSRIPLAAAFVHWADEPPVAVGVLCAAGISDWLDGWVAKRTGTQTPVGALLDPICDRLFVISVLVTLVVVHGLPILVLCAMTARDACNTAGAFVVWLTRPTRLPALRPRRSGKIVTSLQFWTIVHLLSGLPFLGLSIGATILANVWAVVDYGGQWRRILGDSKSVSTP